MKMGKALNLDLLEFHVREAAQELDLLLDAIQYAKGGVHGTGGSRRCRKRMRSSAETRSSRVRVRPVVGSRSSGRSRCYVWGAKVNVWIRQPTATYLTVGGQCDIMSINLLVKLDDEKAIGALE